jgi:hypothetical protein
MFLLSTWMLKWIIIRYDWRLQARGYPGRTEILGLRDDFDRIKIDQLEYDPKLPSINSKKSVRLTRIKNRRAAGKVPPLLQFVI